MTSRNDRNDSPSRNTNLLPSKKDASASDRKTFAPHYPASHRVNPSAAQVCQTRVSEDLRIPANDAFLDSRSPRNDTDVGRVRETLPPLCPGRYDFHQHVHADDPQPCYLPTNNMRALSRSPETPYGNVSHNIGSHQHKYTHQGFSLPPNPLLQLQGQRARSTEPPVPYARWVSTGISPHGHDPQHAGKPLYPRTHGPHWTGKEQYPGLQTFPYSLERTRLPPAQSISCLQGYPGTHSVYALNHSPAQPAQKVGCQNAAGLNSASLHPEWSDAWRTEASDGVFYQGSYTRMSHAVAQRSANQDVQNESLQTHSQTRYLPVESFKTASLNLRGRNNGEFSSRESTALQNSASNYEPHAILPRAENNNGSTRCVRYPSEPQSLPLHHNSERMATFSSSVPNRGLTPAVHAKLADVTPTDIAHLSSQPHVISNESSRNLNQKVDVQKVLALGCKIRNGMVYNAQNCRVCALPRLNGEPCRRLVTRDPFRCSWHNAVKLLDNDNIINGTLDQSGNLISVHEGEARDHSANGDFPARLGFFQSGDDGQSQQRTASPTPEEIVRRKLRWSNEEHYWFLLAVRQLGNQWSRAARVIKTKTTLQVQSHGQKYRERKRLSAGQKMKKTIHDYTLLCPEMVDIANRISESERIKRFASAGSSYSVNGKPHRGSGLAHETKRNRDAPRNSLTEVPQDGTGERNTHERMESPAQEGLKKTVPVHSPDVQNQVQAPRSMQDHVQLGHNPSHQDSRKHVDRHSIQALLSAEPSESHQAKRPTGSLGNEGHSRGSVERSIHARLECSTHDRSDPVPTTITGNRKSICSNNVIAVESSVGETTGFSQCAKQGHLENSNGQPIQDQTRDAYCSRINTFQSDHVAETEPRSRAIHAPETDEFSVRDAVEEEAQRSAHRRERPCDILAEGSDVKRSRMS